MIPDCYGLYGILMRPICIVVEEPRQAQYFDMKWEHRDLSDEGLANSSPCRLSNGARFGAAGFPGMLAGEWNFILFGTCLWAFTFFFVFHLRASRYSLRFHQGSILFV